MIKNFLGREVIVGLRYAEDSEVLYVATAFGAELLSAHKEAYRSYHLSLTSELRFDYVAVLQMLIKERPRELEQAYVKRRLKG